MTVTVTDPDGAQATSFAKSFYVWPKITVAPVADRTVLAGAPIGPIQIQLSDSDFPAEQLWVSAWMDDASLFADSLVITGSGSTRTMNATTASGRSGTTQIWLYVSDLVVSEYVALFQVTVAPFQSIAFTPAPGAYFNPPLVTMTTVPPGGEIWYTTSATGTPAFPIPWQGIGTRYTAPVSFPSTTTVTAAYSVGGIAEATSTATFTVLDLADYPGLVPTFTPPAGSYSDAVDVILSTTRADGVIHYTLDGSIPTAASPVYNSSLHVDRDLRIQALTVAPGLPISPVAVADYVIRRPKPPTFTLASGVYAAPVFVGLSAAAGLSVRYTLDGSSPTPSSPLAAGLLVIAADTTVSAIALTPGGVASAPASSAYRIAPVDVGIPAPAVDYVIATAAGADLVGRVPTGFGIDRLQVMHGDPVTAVTFGELDGDRFRVHLDNSQVPQEGTVIDLVFVATAAPPRASPPTRVTIQYGNGMGGPVTTGSPAGLLPFISGAEITIVGGLTGMEWDVIAGKLYHFTNDSTKEVTVEVDGSAVPGTVVEKLLILSDGRTFPATDGPVTVPVPSEGLIEFTARITAENDGLRTSKTIDEPVRLIVDRSPPKLLFTMRKDYWPTGYDRTAVPEPIVAQRHGTEGWRDVILLNGNGDADNATLRRTRGMNAFDHAGFTQEAIVDDLSGLNPDITQHIEVQTPDRVNQPGTPMVAAEPLQTTIRPPQQPDRDEAQRVSISGFASLPESSRFNAGGGIKWTIGRFLCRIRYEDRAGNVMDETPIAYRIKTADPVIVTREVESNSPARLASIFSYDTAEAWQGSVGTTTRMLSHGSLDEAQAPFRSPWRLNAPFAIPQGVIPPEAMDSVESNSPYPLVFTSSAVSRNFVAQDAYGNRGSPLGAMFAVEFMVSEFLVNNWVIYGSAYASDFDIRSDTAYFTEVYENHVQPLDLGPTEGIHEVTATYSLETGIITRDRLTTDLVFSRYGGERGGLVIEVNNIDPGTGANRRASPAVFTIPPSWCPSKMVPVRASDQGITAYLRNPVTPSPGFFLRSQDGGDTATAVGVAEGGAAITGTLELRRTKPQPSGQTGSAAEAMRPGTAIFHYSPGGEGWLTSYDFTDYYIAGYTGGGPRYATLVRATPDVVASGTHMTIRIEGGFIDKDFSPDDFQELGDYVHFYTHTDVTMNRQAYGDGASIDPDAIKDLIAITGQRFIATGPETTIRQALELDLLIGPDVPVGLCHIDVRLGAVKAYEDQLSLTYKGSGFNGGDSHRMLEALNVIELRAVDKDGPIASITAASVPAPVITLDSLTPYDVKKVATGVVRFTLKGKVTDVLADITSGSAADPTEVIVAGKSFPVERQAGGVDDPFRPYAATYRFTAKVFMSVHNGDNVVTVQAKNKLGNTGYASMSVRAAVDIDQSKLIGAGNGGISIYQASNSMLIAVPEGYDDPSTGAIQVGLEAIQGPSALEPVPLVSPGIYSGITTKLGQVTIALASDLSWDPQTIDTMQPTITVSALGLNSIAMHFNETAIDSGAFRLIDTKLHVRLDQTNAEQIQVGDEIGGVIGTFANLTQEEGAFVGTHPTLGALSVTLGAMAFDPVIRQELLALVTAPGVGYQNQVLSFSETDIDTNDYRQSAIGANIGGTTLSAVGAEDPFTVTVQAVDIHESSSAGLANVLRIRYHNVTETGAGPTSVTVGGRTYDLIDDPDQAGGKVTKSPFIATAGTFNAGGQSQVIPVDSIQGTDDIAVVVTVNESKVMTSQGVSETTSGGRTGAGGRPVQERPKVPRGVKRILVELLHSGWVGLEDISVMDHSGPTINEEDLMLEAIGPDGNIDSKVSIAAVSHKRGSSQILVSVSVDPAHAAQVYGENDNENAVIGFKGKARIKFSQKMAQIERRVWQGKKWIDFKIKRSCEVVDLKVVILALDGGGYNAVDKAIRNGGLLKKMFGATAGSATYDPGPVLNALPTVTFTNWATWVTGQAPKDHGILGNAFFPRDLIGTPLGVPFGCANRTGVTVTHHGTLSILGATLSMKAGIWDDVDNGRAAELNGLVGLLRDPDKLLYADAQVKSSAVMNNQYGDYSLQQKANGKIINNHTATAFSSVVDDVLAQKLHDLLGGGGGSVRVGPGDGSSLLAVAGHGPSFAKALDTVTATRTLEHWNRGVPADVEFLYFPGPDNRAHDPTGANQGGQFTNPGIGAGGTSQNDEIMKHISGVTEGQIEQVMTKIDQRGYRQAVLFVMIADHGLIITPRQAVTASGTVDGDNNRQEGKIVEKLQRVYEQAFFKDNAGLPTQVKLWIGGSADSLSQSGIVHAPSGGMAHIYMTLPTFDEQGGAVFDWSVPTSRENLLHLAQVLRDEDLGVTNRYDETGASTFQESVAKVGSDPAIFVKPAGFADDYQLYLGGNQVAPVPFGVTAIGSTYDAGSAWLDANYRLLQETNDRRNGSRSGDLVMVMNNVSGAIAVNEADQLPGWHGSPSKTESEVPMRWFFAGSAATGVNGLLPSDLIDQVKMVKVNGEFRSRQFRDHVIKILTLVRKGDGP